MVNQHVTLVKVTLFLLWRRLLTVLPIALGGRAARLRSSTPARAMPARPAVRGVDDTCQPAPNAPNSEMNVHRAPCRWMLPVAGAAVPWLSC